METGEQNIENYLDFRLRGGSRERHGHIEWPLEYFRFSERERREGGEGIGELIPIGAHSRLQSGCLLLHVPA